MMAFDVPLNPPTLPATLTLQASHSTEQFRAKLGMFASDHWVNEYSTEILRLMRMAYEKGKIDARGK